MATEWDASMGVHWVVNPMVERLEYMKVLQQADSLAVGLAVQMVCLKAALMVEMKVGKMDTKLVEM